MARMKGGELIAEFLIRENIPYLFGICGHGNVGILDALYNVRDKIRLISPRHEQVAGHMADGYFRVKHRPVATLTSCGPGSANLVMALAVAQTDSSALLALTANVPTSQFNRSPFQELNRHNQADFPNVIRPVVKRSFQPSRVDMLPLALRQAATTMTSGRPGPVNVDVPFNLFQEEADVELEAAWDGFNTRRSGAAPEDIAAAADMVLAAEKPAIFIGHGVTLSEASAELTELVHRLGVPVLSSPNGMGCLHMGDPLSLGFIGRNGTYPANQAGRHADLVLAIGARFDDRSSSSWLPGYSWNFPTTKLIHADLDHGELGRNYAPDLSILADARTFLRQLLAELERRNATKGERLRPWHADIAQWRKEWEAYTRPNFEIHASPLRPERVVADCRAVLPDDAILSLDSGVHHNWYMQFWRRGGRRPCSTPGASPAWASGRALFSAPSWRRPTGPASRCAATAASPWCRMCCAPRSNTTFPSSGWCGTISPGARSVTSNTACSTAASSAPPSIRGRTTGPTIPTSPRSREPAASTASR
jgi:acetolactate synthase-1/2/3 large subunit